MKSFLIVAVGLVLVAAGLGSYWLGTGPRDYGWFAYTPLDGGGDVQFSNGAVVVSNGQWVGLGVAAAGAMVLAGWLGFRLGRRRGSASASAE